MARAPLTKDAVNEMQVETSTVALVQEFLARYFDGAAHDVGLNAAVAFTRPELLFQQSGVTQPSDKKPAGIDSLAITFAWSEPGRKWMGWENDGGNGRQQVVQSVVNWNFWVRATGGKNARKNAKLTGDRLYALLNNTAETHLLGQKGIRRVRPQEPRAVQDGDYTVRLITCSAQLRYLVRSQISQAV